MKGDVIPEDTVTGEAVVCHEGQYLRFTLPAGYFTGFGRDGVFLAQYQNGRIVVVSQDSDEANARIYAMALIVIREEFSREMEILDAVVHRTRNPELH